VLDFDRFAVLTFDCYGTLIDWEAGILAAMRPIAQAHDNRADDATLLETYAAAEADAEAGPYRPYADILREAVITVGDRLDFSPTAKEADAFAASIVTWPAFPDSADALARLRTRFKLAAVTNCDDRLFAASERLLGEPFMWVITAQQAKAYKPSPRMFEVALQTIGQPPDRILHVAQSLYHDHVPAKRRGLSTVWVNRRHDQPGPGATPVAEVQPDLEVADMAALAVLAGV
jgi:2-haloacid dehalogenase